MNEFKRVTLNFCWKQDLVGIKNTSKYFSGNKSQIS